MTAATLYQYLEREIGEGLHRAKLTKGASFFWERKRTNPSSRLIRISERADGGIREIKLAQSSLGGPDVLLPLPASCEAVAEALRGELRKLLDK